MSNWNYFEEPRKIGFGFQQQAVSCRLDSPESIIYWVLDEIQGYKILEIKAK